VVLSDSEAAWYGLGKKREEQVMSSDAVGRPMEILLVEDNLADARLAIEALKDGRIKHRMTLVRDGIEAMKFLQQEGIFSRAPRPDLILLDLELPKKDGRQVLVEVKQDYDLKNIPVVILTASKAHEDLLRSQLLHVEGYMTKPVDLGKFLDLVRQLKRFWLSDVVLPAEV
jgi:two-component system, chemotaxis family, response regulator Rcp1